MVHPNDKTHIDTCFVPRAFCLEFATESEGQRGASTLSIIVTWPACFVELMCARLCLHIYDVRLTTCVSSTGA